MRRSSVALLAVLVLAGCQTTQEKNAQIAKRLGKHNADAAVTKLKGSDPSVRVLSAQIVSTSGSTAAALELTNTSSTPQADIPILITAYDAAGKAVYTNATVGAGSPSGELSLLAAHATAWWVDASVLSSAGAPVRVVAALGAPTAKAPQLTLSAAGIAGGSNFVGPLISGKAINGTSSVLSMVTVYAVALAGSKVLAAGQSVIPTLAANHSSAFQVNVIGHVKGATYAATIAPAHIGQ